MVMPWIFTFAAWAVIFSPVLALCALIDKIFGWPGSDE